MIGSLEKVRIKPKAFQAKKKKMIVEVTRKDISGYTPLQRFCSVQSQLWGQPHETLMKSL